MENHPAAPVTQWSFRRVAGATFTLALVALVFWLLYLFNQVVFILFIAIVIGTVIRPVVVWLYGRGVPRVAGVIVVYLALLAFLIGFLLLLFPLIAEQSATIAAALPGNYESLRDWLFSNPNSLLASLGGFLPATYAGLVALQPTGQGCNCCRWTGARPTTISFWPWKAKSAAMWWDRPSCAWPSV